MITRERLEELTQNGETIYTLDTKMYSCEEWLPLENILEKLEFNEYGQVKLFRADNGWWHWFNLKDLYEDLQWMIEFGCIERTERLTLPTWEESKKCDSICHFDDVEFDYFVHDNTYGLYQDCYKLLDLEATKENYIKACRKAKELFLGEKSDVED